MQGVCSSIFDKCRCCLAEGKHLHSFEVAHMRLFRNLNLIPTIDSRFPQRICLNCVHSLIEVKRFREMVVAAEIQLLQTLGNNIYIPVLSKSLQVTLCKKEDASFIANDDSDEDKHSRFEATDVHSVDEADAEPEDSENEDIVLRIGSTVVKRRVARQASDTSNGIETIVLESSDLEYETVSRHNPPSVHSDELSDLEDTLSNMKEGKPKIEENNVVVEKSNRSYSITNENESKKSFNKLSKTKEKLKPIIPKTITIKSNVIMDTPGRTTRNISVCKNIVLLLVYSTIVPFVYLNHLIKSYKCFYCTNSYQAMKELRDHTVTKHTGKVIEKIIYLKTRRRAPDINVDISCIKCRICSKQFQTIDSLIEHLSKVHKKTYYDTGKKTNGMLYFDFSADTLKCHLCDAYFLQFKDLSTHMADHYGDFICNVCEKKFVSEGKYKRHVNAHEKTKVQNIVICHYCNAKFTLKHSLICHIESKHSFVFKGRGLKCEKCSVTFNYKDYKKRGQHMAKVHGVNKRCYMCDICKDGQQFEGYHKFYYHMQKNHVQKVHTVRVRPIREYQCYYCGKIFHNRKVFTFHVRIHTNDKRYKCMLCDSAFIQQHRLKSHYKSMHSNSFLHIQV